MSKPEAPIWTLGGQEKAVEVRRMFSAIAGSYDAVNSVMTLNLHRHWRAEAACKLNLSTGDSAVDLCSGTGDFLPHLRKAVGPAGRVFGLDFSAPMLSRARGKTAGSVHLVEADALRTPLRSESFEGISVGWGVRNVADIDSLHREAFRLLKPGGRFVSIDTATPENPIQAALSWAAFRTLVPLIGFCAGHFRAYRYLPESTHRFWSRLQLSKSLERAGFVDVGNKDRMAGNICMHWGTKP